VHRRHRVPGVGQAPHAELGGQLAEPSRQLRIQLREQRLPPGQRRRPGWQPHRLASRRLLRDKLQLSCRHPSYGDHRARLDDPDLGPG
jgi:hypothetical protein